jgi:hypothetical protein
VAATKQDRSRGAALNDLKRLPRRQGRAVYGLGDNLEMWRSAGLQDSRLASQCRVAMERLAPSKVHALKHRDNRPAQHITSSGVNMLRILASTLHLREHTPAASWASLNFEFAAKLASKPLNELQTRRPIQYGSEVKSRTLVLNVKLHAALLLSQASTNYLFSLPFTPCFTALVRSSFRIKASGMARSVASSMSSASQR